NDVRKVDGSGAIAACVLNAKGKLNGQVWISTSDDALFLDAEAELREAIHARLERYVIADDVHIEDVTEQFYLFHVIGSQSLNARGNVIAANRFGIPGVDIRGSADQKDAALLVISNAGFLCDE